MPNKLMEMAFIGVWGIELLPMRTPARFVTESPQHSSFNNGVEVFLKEEVKENCSLLCVR
ncbi:hypothetical protein [Rubritalea tangerina]|uniref:hypothetical protein n=1 Tax=Rubritalea tangerina TaxID=430798 RepID=UPI0036197BAD